MADPLRVDEILRVLTRHEAQFVLVGGIAAILHGSPLTTEDLDLLYAAEEENCERLSRALDELEATYRDPAGRRIEPDVEKLRSLRLHLLNTRCGRLDLLRTVGAGSTYEDLLARSRPMLIEEMEIRVLELEAIIETKEEANRPKDLYQLPYLRQLLVEARRLETETRQGEEQEAEEAGSE